MESLIDSVDVAEIPNDGVVMEQKIGRSKMALHTSGRTMLAKSHPSSLLVMIVLIVSFALMIHMMHHT